MSLELQNVVCFVLHTALILFNLVGWIWKSTRGWHALCITATLFSWFAMGAWRGWGYCLCADWHFRVRRAMGLQDNVTTYIQLLFRVLFATELSRRASDVLAVGGLLGILAAMGCVWLRGRRPDKP